jgi:hypothetical protein
MKKVLEGLANSMQRIVKNPTSNKGDTDVIKKWNDFF